MITDWFEVLDARFAALILPNVHVDTLWSGGRWLEGPVYVPAARHLLFSDIPNNRVLRWDEMTGAVGPFRVPSAFANGHALDRAGRVLACEHQTRRVVRFEHDGRVSHSCPPPPPAPRSPAPLPPASGPPSPRPRHPAMTAPPPQARPDAP